MVPDTPEGAYTPTDDELDDLVAGAEGDDDEGADEPSGAPEPASPDTDAPARADAEPGRTDGTDNASAGSEGTDDEDEEPTPATDPAAAPAAAAAPAPPSPAIPGSKPFQFKASGQERTLPGVFELPDGSVTVPKAEVGRFRQTLASAVELQRVHQQFRRDTARQLRDLQEGRTEKDVTAEAVLKLFDGLADKTEDEAVEWVLDFIRTAPQKRLDIREEALKHREAQLERQAKGPEPLPEEVEEQRTANLTQALNASFAEIAKNAEVKRWLTQEELERIYKKHLPRVGRLVSKLDKDDPETGWKKGTEVFDPAEIGEDVQLAIDLKKRAAANARRRRENDRLNADTRPGAPRIPPGPRGGRPAAAARTGAAPKEKFDKDAFMRGDLDDDTVE